jgi:eukaryotic-like serine/threonine-protein kinase
MSTSRAAEAVTLAAGIRIGPFEVIEPLGAGAMGEVYRARDLRLERDVAMKMLPESFALDASRRARFEREARVLASLNHPNIATLYGIEESPAGQALVMELVEGGTLADRLALADRRGGAPPMREVLSIAQQVAAGLEAAHEQGIVHRDLKPANIGVRPDGTVKVLDFGLAKAIDVTPAAAEPQAAVTVTDIAGADIGPGTPAYMSPEQARGLRTDKRTDIWAFGCVLYELLTGHRAFDGDRTSDVVARILEREPDFSIVPPETPAAIRRLLRRCLEKDLQDRLRDIGDARLEIRDASRWEQSAAPTPLLNWRWALAGAAVAGIITSAAVWMVARPDANPVPRVTRFAIPAEVAVGGAGRSLTISPDGSRLVYTSPRGFVVRARDRLDEISIHALGARSRSPFVSPDGEWIGYSDGQALYKVSTSGGAPVSIAEIGPGAIGSWSADDILFADIRGLFRVSAQGGTPQKLQMAALDPAEQATFPELLPGGRAVLFTVIPMRTISLGLAGTAPGARIEVLNLQTGMRKTIVRGGSRGRYVRTGHLVYAAAGSLFAAPFDINRLELRGDPVPLVPDVAHGEFAVADDGTLTYASGGDSGLRTLVWVDRQGREEPLETPPRGYLYPRLSPDGTRVALDVSGPPARDIWIWDLRRRALERFTNDPAGNPVVAWSPDGKLIAFGSDRFGPTTIYVQPADGRAEPQRLMEADRIQLPLAFAPDGRLLFSEEVPRRGRDIRAVSLDGSRRVESIVHSPGVDGNAEVSPNGRWIAYDSNESGEFEIYVRPYPDAGRARWQISIGGGRQPLWSHDGRELFYRDFSGAVMSVPLALGPTFTAGRVVTILEGSAYAGRGPFLSGRTYDLSLDGRRFLMVKPVASGAAGSLVVVLNWFEELKRRVPRP